MSVEQLGSYEAWLIYNVGWKQFLGPQAMAKLQTTCPTFRAALHHDYKSEASALVTILEDEVLSLKKELKVQRIRNEIIYRKIKRTL